MENLKHTKGEWVVEQSGAMPKQRIRSDKKQIICDCYSFSESIKDDEAEANAKLIAAAPDLLEACLFSNMFPITTEREEDLAKEKALKLGWKMDMPLENFAYQLRKNAIKKATNE